VPRPTPASLARAAFSRYAQSGIQNGDRGMARDQEFSEQTKFKALCRQNYRCASCGESIQSLKAVGRINHSYGEAAHAHHIRHVQQGGTNDPFNCVIICESCHYSAHEGGNYRSRAVWASQADFPYFDG
jgi:5-methylcytosine-specific restriction endonuclease McrA